MPAHPAIRWRLVVAIVFGFFLWYVGTGLVEDWISTTTAPFTGDE